MNSTTRHDDWLREMGATSRGMMFLGGSFATLQALQASDATAHRRGGTEETGATRGLLGAVLAAALMVAPAVGSVVAGDTGSDSGGSGRIVDLPTVTVRPSAVDAEAYRHSRRIVELDAVVVHPRKADRALYLAMLESGAAPLASLDAQR